jgi:hypothetical protein
MSGPSGPSVLEQRYRRLLRWLPEPARSRWADDMLATYLEAATGDDPEFADFGSPSVADRWDVARLAVRLRLGAPGASVRSVVAGRTLWLVALVGCAALATTSAVALLGQAWVAGWLPWLATQPLAGSVGFGPREWALVGLDLLTVALPVFLLLRLRAARVLAAGIWLGSAAVLAGQLPWLPPAALLPLVWTGVPLLAAVLAPLDPSLPRPRWLLLLPVVVAAPVLAWFPASPEVWLVVAVSTAGTWTAGLVVAAVLVLVRRSTTPAAPLAVAVLGSAHALLLAGQIAPPPGGPPGYAAVVLTSLVVAVVVVVVTGLAGARAVRALPAGVALDQSGSIRS